MDIITLNVELSARDASKVSRYLNVILHCAVQIEDLSFPSNPLSANAQRVILRKVALPNLLRMVMHPASYTIVLPFIAEHCSSLRDLVFHAAPLETAAIIPSINPSHHLTLHTIDGPLPLIASVLDYCDRNSLPHIRLTLPTAPLSLDVLQLQLAGHQVLNLTVTLDAMQMHSLSSLAACFPYLRCLKVVEKCVALQDRDHIWNASFWPTTLAAMPGLQRVSVSIPKAKSVALSVHAWFPHVGTAAALNVELSAGDVVLQMWKKPWGTTKWSIIYMWK
ncbi:hypothetical protein GGF50DRAFT_121128 [Schizophyllum commune]